MITFICIFYYIFSVFFMSGYISDTDESNPWIIIGGSILVLIAAPILFPFNLDIYIHKNS